MIVPHPVNALALRSRNGRFALLLVLCAGLGAGRVAAQVIDPARGVDARVDYRQLDRFGPWDDRNYALTRADLALLAPDEADQREAIPAFYRVLLRRRHPDLRRSGPAQYPRSALPRFLIEYGGYLYEGVLYRSSRRVDGRNRLVLENGVSLARAVAERLLQTDVRVTSPTGGAESAVAINPVDPDLVIAGSNGPGSGQTMHYSTDGGETWSAAAALPGGGTCCDPTVAWSSDGTKAYAATLGSGVWIYRSGDAGQSWNDLPTTPRRELGVSSSDKEYLHVDTFATSPYLDNVYLTWHEGNTMYFSRSTDFANTWSTKLSLGGAGIGSDVTSDASGNVYYLWPDFAQSSKIVFRKSTDGGVSFAAAADIATTQAEFIFPVPSMEEREVFVYVAADTDRTGGPYADSVYAAWTDSTGQTTGSPSNNHARIQVASSRNGGASWTVTTPHPTADAATVDRYHPWLSVANDGSVHVVFYDTSRDATRQSVDLYHSVSTDGAQTWSTPDRLSSEPSPNIEDSFELGDYNGLDVVLGRLVAVFTDNRSEDGGAGDSVDVYASGRILDHADLSITKTDGVETVVPGGQLTYTIVATNAGPAPVSDGVVTDDFPPGLTCTWTCAVAFGASCTAGPVSGDIADTVGLPLGGTATYTAVCDVAGDATGTLVNTAIVESSSFDPTAADRSATDETSIESLPCTLDSDVTLANQTITTTVVVEACSSITAGPALSIVAPAQVTLRARQRVVLVGGFSVGSGATFAVDIDPAVGSP